MSYNRQFGYRLWGNWNLCGVGHVVNVFDLHAGFNHDNFSLFNFNHLMVSVGMFRLTFQPLLLYVLYEI